MAMSSRGDPEERRCIPRASACATLCHVRPVACPRVREPACHDDLNAQMRRWIGEVASQRVHGTTHEQVMARREADRVAMNSVNGRPPHPYLDDEQRKVARDAYVS